MARRRVLTRGVADPEAVSDWSSSLSDSYIMCRDMGHTWRPYRAWYDPEEHGYQRILRCGRCKTERKQFLSESGLVMTGSYDYPDGYQAPPGTGHLDSDGRGALRLESTLRLIGADER